MNAQALPSKQALPAAQTLTAAQGLPVGWHADLELAFELRESGTVLSRNTHRGPLQVQKALYPEGRGTCHVAVLHPPGGIAASDRLCIRADLSSGARALLTTPGATKWYRSEGDQARQQQHFRVSGDAVLEWLPRENIVFDGARVALNLDVDLAPQARYFGWEILSFGRRASGERWQRGHLEMSTRVRRAQQPLWSELAHVDAASGFMESAVGLAGCGVCGTFLVAGAAIDDGLLSACRQVEATRTRCAVTRVPEVLIARYLGHSTEEAFGWFTRLWAVVRPVLTGRIACAPRFWAC